MTKPQYLTTCPSCGEESPRWTYTGFQGFPAALASNPQLRARLEKQTYIWHDGEIGCHQFTCSCCGSTASDTPEE